jgi:formylmethanofuran--tetrahydromethanopterin N-formyltransferase
MVEIEDTYCEAFDGLFSRIIITAKDERRLRKAAYGATALPSTVFGKSEGGVEKWLNEEETPDGRKGAIVQIWVNYGKRAKDVLDSELSWRIRQGVLVVPTTTLFNALNSDEKIDVMEKIGHCGDGYEFIEEYFGREVINIPIMMPEFRIERLLGCGRGVMGGNLWFMCKTENAALEAGDKTIEAIGKVDGVVTPFDICSAGSKPETRYPEIGPTTNHQYCPTLKDKIKDSQVPEGVNYIPEVVINGVALEAIREAMKAAIYSVQDIKGLLRISAGNYGGKLGKYKIWLRELFQ